MKKLLVIVALLSFTVSTFTKAQSVVAKREFNNTLKAYFEAKNALAKDNAVLASESVKGLIKNIDEFPVKTLSAEQQVLWKDEAAAIKKAALAISTEKALKAANLTIEDIDAVELNEAFASQSVAIKKELGLNPDILNVNGGAIALGHPLGCTGTKLTVQLLDEMRRRGNKYGMVSMCVGTGQGAASIFELL